MRACGLVMSFLAMGVQGENYLVRDEALFCAGQILAGQNPSRKVNIYCPLEDQFLQTKGYYAMPDNVKTKVYTRAKFLKPPIDFVFEKGFFEFAFWLQAQQVDDAQVLSYLKNPEDSIKIYLADSMHDDDDILPTKQFLLEEVIPKILDDYYQSMPSADADVGVKKAYTCQFINNDTQLVCASTSTFTDLFDSYAKRCRDLYVSYQKTYPQIPAWDDSQANKDFDVFQHYVKMTFHMAATLQRQEKLAANIARVKPKANDINLFAHEHWERIWIFDNKPPNYFKDSIPEIKAYCEAVAPK